MRLLLIEDDEMIGKSLREGLRRENHGVDWVRDGWAAEQSLIATDYDLLILDLGLPRMHGLQVLKNARQKRKIGRCAGQAAPVFRHHGGVKLNPLTREVLLNGKTTTPFPKSAGTKA